MVARLTIITPVFNDWPCVATLLERLDAALEACGERADVLIVDDGSTEAAESEPALGRLWAALERVEVLELRCNLGHQRAIALGLCHLSRAGEPARVAVMDGDGQDRPEDLPELLRAFEACGGKRVVFAERAKRLESLWFQAFYQMYRVLHRLLTGIEVRVGNFSVCPWPAVRRLAVMGELWNHYAACVFRSRLPYSTVKIDRGARIRGKSAMNFVALAAHGLSAISVYGDAVAVRVLTACSVGVLALAGCIAAVALAGAAEAWTLGTLLAGMLWLAQAVPLGIGFALRSLANRSATYVIPEQVYPAYVSGVREWKSRNVGEER
jgi:glycosyltransferase involved in cell wall biosynthesis